MKKKCIGTEKTIDKSTRGQYMVLKKGHTQMTIPIPRQTYMQFKAIVKKNDMTVAQVVRQFVRNYIMWINEEQAIKMHNVTKK